MLPFGGHKGSAIGTMVELLAGIMIGDLTSPEPIVQLGTTTLLPLHGELIIAFSPEAFSKGRFQEIRSRAQNCFLTPSWVKALDCLHSDVFSPARDRKAKEFVSHLLRLNNSIASFSRDLTQSRGT